MRSLVIALAAVLLARRALAGLISSSQVQSCINDGGATVLNCTRTIVVALAVRSGANATDAIVATLSEATDTDGALKTMQTAVRITLQKTPKYLAYALTYAQSFNNKPTELTRAVGPGFSGFFDPCEDRPSAPASTCDPVLDAQGARVPDAQGFCCYCSLAQV